MSVLFPHRFALFQRSFLPVLLLCAGCATQAPAPPGMQEISAGPRQVAQRAEAQGMPARLLLAGDIGQCDKDRKPRESARATAALLDDRPGLVVAAGDLAYPDGSLADFADCFDASWGLVRSRMLPAPGNHEYKQTDGAGYFQYFGSQAGVRGLGWYSVDFAGWHIIALNSNLPLADGSPQLQWLREDLAGRPPGCLLAFWHHPRFSSGEHGNNAALDPAWRTLAAAGADLVVTGHDHDYERFAPLDGAGNADPAGIREFVVGTGGAHLRPFTRVAEHSEVRDSDTFGILELNLRRDGYDWRFLGIDGAQFEDRGSGQCHHPGR